MKNEAELIDLVSDLRQRLTGPAEMRELDPFEFISANELALSEVIRWFLDPKASHGEGQSFFVLFCKAFDISLPEQAEARRARCEIATDANRRIDIVVECAGFTVAIESKPYSTFSDMQLPDYFEHLTRGGGPFALVALKGWVGSIPTGQIVQADGDACQFIDADYYMLVDWLDDLRLIAQELVSQLQKNVTVDWHLKESARAKLRVLVRRILKKFGYPPDLAPYAVSTVISQAEALLQWSR